MFWFDFLKWGKFCISNRCLYFYFTFTFWYRTYFIYIPMNLKSSSNNVIQSPFTFSSFCLTYLWEILQKVVEFYPFTILSISIFAQLLGMDIQTHTDTWTHRHTFPNIGLRVIEGRSQCTMRKKTNLIFNFQGEPLIENCIF